MTSKREVLRQQRRWAKSHGLAPDSRGYLATVEANLFKPMSASARADFERGDGAELAETARRPAKMRALHSSAALVVNVFDHFVRVNPAPLLNALGIASEPGARISFEARLPTGLPGNPPNLDVALKLASGSVVGIESKFTEWLTPKAKNKAAFKSKYFEGAQLWRDTGLPKCQTLAAGLQSRNERFRFLDAPQLLKHVLGLARQYPGKFALYYLYFDVPGRAAEVHREEAKRFDECVGREIAFKALTYQDLFRALRVRRDVDGGYIGYLRERYFPDGDSLFRQ
jgi:hypothetical protein